MREYRVFQLVPAIIIFNHPIQKSTKASGMVYNTKHRNKGYLKRDCA